MGLCGGSKWRGVDRTGPVESGREEEGSLVSF